VQVIVAADTAAGAKYSISLSPFQPKSKAPLSRAGLLSFGQSGWWPLHTTERSDRISLRGNDKEDYELHFRFSDDKCATGTGDLWFASDNRPEEFSVPVKFQQ
jgi:hypothetical protein